MTSFRWTATVLALCGGPCLALGMEAPRGFESIERAVLQFMHSQHLPGAALAVAKNGRLVFAQGYGDGGFGMGRDVRADSLFRTGSIGKTLTSLAVMRLVEKRRLSLDAKAFDLIPSIKPMAGGVRDARISKITVRNLLQHTAGWDRAASGDPMLYPRLGLIASALKVSYPPTCPAIISYMLAQPLDFDPGTRFGYSNFGYCVLGRIIESVSGKPYFQFVTDEILSPLGINRMRLARTSMQWRADGEVEYYDYPGAPLIDSMMPGVTGRVPIPYSGTVVFEIVDSAGGLIGSAIDLVRIYLALDGSKAPVLLRPESFAEMLKAPPYWRDPPDNPPAWSWPGLGIGVDTTPGGLIWWHDGGGTSTGIETLVARLPNGYVWAAMFNSAPKDDSRFTEELRQIFDPAALDTVEWPDIDLFAEYYPTGRPSVASGCAANSASWQSGSIAPGERISIAGTFLGPAPPAIADLLSETSIPKRLGGSEVLFNGIPAPLLYVSQMQIDAIAPYSAADANEAVIEVLSNGYRSDPCALAVVPAEPGLFTLDGSGVGQVLAINFDGLVNGPTRAAKSGETVTVYATGLGETEPMAVDGALYPELTPVIKLPVRVLLDGTDAPVLSARLAPGHLPGIAEVQIRVPPPSATGAVPIRILVGDASSVQPTTLHIAPEQKRLRE